MRRTRQVRTLVAAGLCAALASACAATDSKTDKTSDRGAADAFRTVLAAKDLTGTRVGPAPADKQATLMVVFASWCGPCREELATLAEIRKAEPRLRIIGLNAYEEWGERSDEKRLRNFLAQNAPWLQAVRADGAILQALGGVPKVPSVFVYDRSGKLVQAFRRSERAPATKPELESAIAKAIAAPAAG